MPKRPTGQGNAVLQPGRTRHQRMADDLLTAHGFVFERRTGHGANLYRHPDGRTENVNGTPANPGGEYARIKRRIRAGETTTEETDMPTKSEVSPVAQFVAMSDPFLLKQPESALEVRARNSALVGWVKRVLERHGPVLSADLGAAAEQMGFTARQIKNARIDAGAVAFARMGEGKGRGRGGQVVYAALPHQVPENASIVGRPRVEPERNGVAVTDEEARDLGLPVTAGEAVQQGVETGEVAGFKVEHRGDVSFMDGPDTIDESAGGDPTHPLNAPSTPAENGSENPDAPVYVPGSITLAAEGDVAAAAFMLLESLGVKKPGDEARQQLREVDNELARVESIAHDARIAIRRALESLA